ncbi:MAG: myo-inositol 2-dehydrogenase / D-chiro-inositol 1-dehydrogenase, partial [Chloroflexota bacterium]|nr:myo-inositol 2-dehydrogenase / D-chiro-inositol 1-dehydrogenase [Chloroflexota bacterium]
GRIGAMHAETLSRLLAPGELVVADLDEERARTLAVAVGAEAASIDEAIAGADALVIAASSNAHSELIRAGIDHKLPIFCEKPLSISLDETSALVDEIEASGIRFQLGFQRRFDPAYVEARRRFVAGDLGIVYLVRMVASDHAPPPEAYIPTSGGVFRDSSIHDFDAIRWMTGSEVESVYADGDARGFEMLARHDDVGTVAVVLRMRNGILGVLGGGRHNPPGYDIRMELIGSRDTVAMGLTDRTPIVPLDAPMRPMRPGWDSFIDRFEQAYRDELRAFVQVARGEAASACTARDGLEAMRIAEAASRSLVERRPIDLDEIIEGEKEVEPAS